jgi:hypothetical protein
VLLRHPRSSGTELETPPKGTEDDAALGYALIPLQAGGRTDTKVVVNEARPVTSTEDWLSTTANDAVKEYLADPKHDPAAAKALEAAWEIRNRWLKLRDEETGLQRSQRELEKGLRDTRLSLQAIEKNNQAGDLRAKLTARLRDDSQKMDGLTKRLVELGMLINEQEVRFRDAVNGLLIRRK